MIPADLGVLELGYLALYGFLLVALPLTLLLRIAGVPFEQGMLWGFALEAVGAMAVLSGSLSAVVVLVAWPLLAAAWMCPLVGLVRLLQRGLARRAPGLG